MTHIEASQKINTTKKVDLAELKYALTQRIRGAFHVETVGDGKDNFPIVAGRKSNFFGGMLYSFQLNVLLKSDAKHARIVVNGNAEITQSARLLYTAGIFLILILGLFPGSIDTSDSGGPLDTIVILIIGAFLIYDINQKLAEPQKYIEKILKSLDVEFGV